MRTIHPLLATTLFFLSVAAGFFYDLINPTLILPVASAITIVLALIAMTVTAQAQADRTYYTPLLLSSILGMLSLSAYTAVPYGQYTFGAITEYTRHLTLASTCAVFLTAITTWWLAKSFTMPWVRIGLATALFASMSWMASAIGALIGLWSPLSHLTSLLGGVVSGGVYALVAEWSEPIIPTDVIPLTTPFPGFCFGIAITNGLFGVLIISFAWGVLLLTASIHE